MQQIISFISLCRIVQYYATGQLLNRPKKKLQKLSGRLSGLFHLDVNAAVGDADALLLHTEPDVFNHYLNVFVEFVQVQENNQCYHQSYDGDGHRSILCALLALDRNFKSSRNVTFV